MFVLDPVNAVTSVQFYKKVSKQSAWRTAGYVAYLGLLFGLGAAVAMKLRLGPSIDQMFDWLGQSVPRMELADGRITSDIKGPLTLRHPKMPDMALVIDTARTEPVDLAALDKAQAAAYLTNNALYVRRQAAPGQPDEVEPLPFERVKTTRVVVDAAFFKAADRFVNRLMYPVVFLFAWLFSCAWRLVVTLFYSVALALALNSMSEANLPYPELFKVTLYSQTLVVVLQIIFLFMSAPLPLGWLLSAGATSVYLWLALRAHVQAPAAPAA